METTAKAWNGKDALHFPEDELRKAAIAHRKQQELQKEITAMGIRFEEEGLERDEDYWRLVKEASDLKKLVGSLLSDHPQLRPVVNSNVLGEKRARLVAEIVSDREGKTYEAESHMPGSFFAVMLRRPGVKQKYIALSKSESGRDIHVRLLLRRTGARVRWNQTTGRPHRGATIFRRWDGQPAIVLPVGAFFSYAYREEIAREYERQRDAILA